MNPSAAKRLGLISDAVVGRDIVQEAEQVFTLDRRQLSHLPARGIILHQSQPAVLTAIKLLFDCGANQDESIVLQEFDEQDRAEAFIRA